MHLEQEALARVAELGGLVADVIGAPLTGNADSSCVAARASIRGDIREFVADCKPIQLAALVDDLVAAPPFVRWLTADAAFRHVLAKVGQSDRRPRARGVAVDPRGL